jgi:glycine cleavage system H protein
MALADTEIPKTLLYSLEDEWVRQENGSVVVGITDYAQQQLGDIVFVELPPVGRAVAKGDAFGVIESVKAVSDLYAPISGTVTAINEELADAPERVNEDCYGSGWMCRIEPDNPGEVKALLDARAYETHVDERSE